MHEDPPETTDTPEQPDGSAASEAADLSSAESSAESTVRELEDALEEARKNAERFKDQLLRKAAEFENYRKRTEAEFSSLSRNANELLLLSLLPVLDDFERFLKHAGERKEYEALVRGAELVLTKLTRTLEQHGLRQFTSAGEPFDVGLHDALLQVPRADVQPGTVVEEVERGYRLHERVLRHAKVIVSTAPPDDLRSSEGAREDQNGEE
jgi:molecular chaperone GrpE